jgi:hypothetical protein
MYSTDFTCACQHVARHTFFEMEGIQVAASQDRVFICVGLELDVDACLPLSGIDQHGNFSRPPRR